MTNELTIRPLTYQDNQEIQSLDDMSGNDVAQWFQEEDDYCEDYAYGLFLNNRLIGYCTIGGADDCPLMIAKHKLYSYNALLDLEKVAFEKNTISELSDLIPLDRTGAIKTFKKAGFIHTELENKELVFGKESISRQLLITKEMYKKSEKNDN